MDTTQTIDYVRKTDCKFVIRKMGENHVLVSVGEGIKNFNGYLTMNETAIFLWNAMGEKTRPEELVELLMKTYDIDEELAAKDVGDFLSVLLENNIVEGEEDVCCKSEE